MGIPLWVISHNRDTGLYEYATWFEGQPPHDKMDTSGEFLQRTISRRLIATRWGALFSETVLYTDDSSTRPQTRCK
jgi:hypothetical protein